MVIHVCIYIFLILGKATHFYLKKMSLVENVYEKHVSIKPGGVLYYMWMLPSKIMPYLF